MEEEEDDSSMLLPSEDLIEKIMENMWRFNDWYSVSNVVSVTVNKGLNLYIGCTLLDKLHVLI